jgi:hypothetical protein
MPSSNPLNLDLVSSKKLLDPDPVPRNSIYLDSQCWKNFFSYSVQATHRCTTA